MSGERFIAVRVDKIGATETLKPNLVGLSNMAIQFLPTDYKFVEVLEATREIVSGVRYELLVAALDGNDETVLCRIIVTELTWKLTAWGEKQRDLNYSNCTSNATTDDNNVPKPNDFSFNPLFVRKSNVVSEDDLKLIESQIIKPKQTEKSWSNPSELFDLSNLEAMIIPSKSSPQSVKTPLRSHIQNEINAHTQRPSESQLVKDSNNNQQFEQQTDSIYHTSNAKWSQSSYEAVIEPLSEKQLSKSARKENESQFEEITMTSENSDTHNQPIILKVTSESPSLDLNDERKDEATNTETSNWPKPLSTQKITESQTESLVEGTTLHEVTKVAFEVVNVQTTTESASLQLSSSIIPSPESILVLEILPKDDEAINEATESLNHQESVENQEVDRPKRDINTEMLFLKQLTNEALEQLDHIDSDNFKRIALDIIRVKKVDKESGAIYVIKVRTANSDCLEESDEQQPCLDAIRQDTVKICLIEVKLQLKYLCE